MTAIHDITLQCPVCGTWFASHAASTDTEAVGTSTDFQRRVKGLDPLAYQVHLCAACGYAGAEEEFASDAVAGASAAALTERDGTLTTCGTLTGSEKYEAAAAVLEGRAAPARAVADLLIRAAWCCVAEGDGEAERYFRRRAAWAFEQALGGYDGVARGERAVLTYLVGELWRRAGDRAQARRWFDRVPSEAADPITQGWVVALASQQRDRPREWLG
jgi:uncharacterized protein (DUF2225 family)